MLKRSSWPAASAVALVALTLAAVPACTSGSARTTAHGTPAHSAPAPGTAPRITPMTDISRCAGSSSEVEEAFAPPGYVYAEWIGCHGIGFARSADSGRHFGPALTVPGSRGFSWDPAITVAADGTVYAAFMHSSGSSYYPVIAVSRDHGASFAQVHPDLPPAPGNWGDRDFIAAGPSGELYLTWDYGPSMSAVKTVCARGGSCAYSAGDLNVVLQTSRDGGATWGPLVHLEPGFPLGGGYSAPLIVAPDGHVDVLYDAHPTDRGSDAVHPGYEYFTSSADGTRWPAAPRPLWPGQGTLSLPAWWIDGDLSADAAGDLYATWDTQTAAGDIGWLTWSRDAGRTWSAPVRVTPDTDRAPHIVESAGGGPGVAYIAWQTSGGGPGYATYLRPFSVTRGWLGPAVKVSGADGKAGIWPGDTFGIALLPDGAISLTWGSAVGTSRASAIYASVVTLGALPADMRVRDRRELTDQGQREEDQPERYLVEVAQFATAGGEGEHDRGRDGQDEGQYVHAGSRRSVQRSGR
ncbi:MAG TPA: sialidase family protein [Streptosporangiaceae bacterium]|nr:sialidase family protein [Streptosporangiaceae bacterium]